MSKRQEHQPRATVGAKYPPVSAAGWATQAPHWACMGVGKFDCEYDENLYDLLNEIGAGDGDAEAPTGWWQAFEIGENETFDLEHYGAQWLLARGDSNGFFWVTAYLTEQSRDLVVTELSEQYSAWLSATGEAS